jgi:hypothetical protein
MRCKNCKNDLGYIAGMIWPPYKETCKLKRRPVISSKGFLYNRKCNEKSIGG